MFNKSNMKLEEKHPELLRSWEYWLGRIQEKTGNPEEKEELAKEIAATIKRITED